MSEDREARLKEKILHDFQGCPSLCTYCEMALLTETEHDECELRTIKLLKDQIRAAWEREKRAQYHLSMIRRATDDLPELKDINRMAREGLCAIDRLSEKEGE